MKPLDAQFWTRMTWHAKERRRLAQLAFVAQAEREHIARYGHSHDHERGNRRMRARGLQNREVAAA